MTDDDSAPTDSGSTEPAGRAGRLSPALIATLIAIPVMVLAGFITYAALRPSVPVPIESYAAVDGTAEECAGFIEALPEKFDGFGDKEVDGDTVRWPATSGTLTLRCGVERPADLNPSSSLQVVHPVQWYMTETEADRGQAFVCVDHRPYVALWVPVEAGNGPITDISALIAELLPRGPIELG